MGEASEWYRSRGGCIVQEEGTVSRVISGVKSGHFIKLEASEAKDRSGEVS